MSPTAERIPADYAGTEPVFSVESWCHALGISIPLYYKECRAGRGPHRANIARRVIINESPNDYVRRMAASIKGKRS